MPAPKGSGVMPILFLSRESPNLAIVDWCLIASQEVSIGEYVIEIMVDHFFRFRCLSFPLVDFTEKRHKQQELLDCSIDTSILSNPKMLIAVLVCQRDPDGVFPD